MIAVGALLGQSSGTGTVKIFIMLMPLLLPPLIAWRRGLRLRLTKISTPTQFWYTAAEDEKMI